MLETIILANYSDILSTIAILISAGTAALSFYAFFRKIPKIKIKFPFPETNIIFQALSNDGYPAPARISILIEIANLSSEPITISRFKLIPSDRPNDIFYFEHFMRAADLYPVAIYDDNCHAYVLPIGKQQLLLPLRLESFSTAIGYIFMPTVAEIKSFSGTLIAETANKEFRTPVKINLPETPHPIYLQSLPTDWQTKE